MIRLSYSKPKLTLTPSHNDMGSFTPGHWSVNDYYYLGLTEYMEKLEFDQFDLEQVGIQKKELESGNLNAIIMNAVGSIAHLRMDKLIKKAGGQLWQFNAVSSDLTRYVRQIVALGDNRLTRWTWVDAYIKLPILQFTATILNKLIAHRARKQIRAWSEFLEKLRKQA